MPESDIDRLLQMLIKSFPVDFSVPQGGAWVRIKVGERFVVLGRDGKWDYDI